MCNEFGVTHLCGQLMCNEFMCNEFMCNEFMCNEFMCNEFVRKKKRDSNHKLLPLLEVREVNQNGSSGAISGGSFEILLSDEVPNISAKYLLASDF